jgi:hypothetical protein
MNTCACGMHNGNDANNCREFPNNFELIGVCCPEVALVVFVWNHQPEIQYLKTSISEEQRTEFARLLETAIGQIEAAQFPSHNGIRFPQNGCVSCPHLGLCLDNETLIEGNLIRTSGVNDLPDLTSQWVNRGMIVTPEINHPPAALLLNRIDEILSWEKTKEQEKDIRFVELGEYLCEVRAKQYWRLEKLNSFDEFVEKRFVDSRRKAYYLMTIREHLTRVPKPQLREMGWTKARELVKVARRDGAVVCALWVDKAKALPKEQFKREVERHLTGKGTEKWEILYFKVYRSQLGVGSC